MLLEEKSEISIFKYLLIHYNLKKHDPLKGRIFARTWIIELAYRAKDFVLSFYQKFDMHHPNHLTSHSHSL